MDNAGTVGAVESMRIAIRRIGARGREGVREIDVGQALARLKGVFLQSREIA